MPTLHLPAGLYGLGPILAACCGLGCTAAVYLLQAKSAKAAQRLSACCQQSLPRSDADAQSDEVVSATHGPLAAPYLFSTSSRPARHLYSSSATTCLLSSQQQVSNAAGIWCVWRCTMFTGMMLCRDSSPAANCLLSSQQQASVPSGSCSHAVCLSVPLQTAGVHPAIRAKYMNLCAFTICMCAALLH